MRGNTGGTVVSPQFDEVLIKEIDTLFRALDTNGNGRLSASEVMVALQSVNGRVSKKDAEHII